jgi:hypothetical protein
MAKWIVFYGAMIILFITALWKSDKDHVSVPPILPTIQHSNTLQFQQTGSMAIESKPPAIQPTIKNGIRHYENRFQLPFDEMISKAEQTVEMSAITFRILTFSYFSLL